MNLTTLRVSFKRISFKKYSYAVIACVLSCTTLGSWPQAQDFTLRYFELRDLFHTPGEVLLSPEYQTVIEFDGLTVERVSSGRTDEIVAEVVDNTIRLRANGYIVNTDLTVMAGGQTALFKLTGNAGADAPRVYLVRNDPPTRRPQGPPTGSASSAMAETQDKTDAVSEDTNAEGEGEASELTQTDTLEGVDFRASVYHAGEKLIIQYVLGNTASSDLIAEPERLQVRYADITLPYSLERIPLGSTPNTIEEGSADYGTLVIDNAPQDKGQLELRWTLFRGDSARHYTLVRNLEAIPVGLRENTPQVPVESVSEE